MKTILRHSRALVCAILMTFGLATSQAQTTANWIGPASGGEWNTGANWDTGFPPLDTTTNAFVGPGTNVNYDLPMPTSGFGLLTLNGSLVVNTNGFNNTGILMNFPTGTKSLWITNAGAAVNITGDLTMGSNTVANLAPGASLTVNGNLIIAANEGSKANNTSAFTNSGGTLNASSTFVNNNTGTGTGLLRITGGTNNLGNTSVGRYHGTSASTLGTEGLAITGGLVTISNLTLSGPSYLTAFISGGTVTNYGTMSINGITAGRYSRMFQTGGYVVVPQPGVINLNSTTAGSLTAIYSVTGGTNIVGGFYFGNSNAPTAATQSLTNSSVLYIGSLGITADGTSINTLALNNGGMFGAEADWTGNANMLLTGGAYTFQAAAQDSTAHNITLSGALSGTGALNKTGTGALTLAGSNTYSGATLINNGTLALATDLTSGSIGSLFSPTIIVGSGTTYDVSQVAGYSVNGLQTLSGSGTVIGPVSIAASGIINPGSNSVAGTLTFNNDVTETNGAVNHLDLPGDLINVLGALNLSGSNLVEVAGALTAGTPYALIHYGSLSGDVSNLGLSGATGTLSNSVTDKTIYLVVTSTLRGNTNINWVGNSVANDWDTHNLTNWVDGGTAALDFFLSGDRVRFDNLGGINTNVNIPASVSPGSIVVDSTSNYVFSGIGLIAGPSTLTKTNSGTLTILTTNSYSGVTTLGGGTVEVLSVANGGLPSPLGGTTADPTFVVFNGGALRYSGDSASSDRGATLVTNAVIDVTNSATTLSLSGTLTGTGGYTKAGQGTLIVSGANSYLGSTTISNGTLQVNSATTALDGPVVFAGGTLSMNVGSQPTYSNPLNIATTGTLISAGGNNNVIAAPWSGAGTLNINIPSGTLTINSDMTPNFTGSIVISDASTGFFRFNGGGNGNGAQQSTASATASFDLGNSTVTLLNRNGGALAFGIYSLGSLAGGPDTFVRGASNGGGTSNVSYYAIGAKNLDTTYAGTIADGSGGAATCLIKVGTGKLTLTGASSYTGLTVVSNGVLALGDGVTDGSLGATTNILISAGAVLDVSRRSDGTLQQNSGQVLSGSGTLRGSVNAFGTVAPGTDQSTGTLTVTNVANLLNTTWMKLNRGTTPDSDRLVAPTINLGGTLVLTNIGAPLHAGDTFTLFQGTLGSSFSSIITPNYYTFNTTQVAVNGTVTVTSYTPPTMTADYSAFSTGTITFNAAGGIPGNAVSVLSSTNLSLPRTNWTAVATGNFDGAGAFTAPVTIDTTIPSQYYILSAQ